MYYNINKEAVSSKKPSNKVIERKGDFSAVNAKGAAWKNKADAEQKNKGKKKAEQNERNGKKVFGFA